MLGYAGSADGKVSECSLEEREIEGRIVIHSAGEIEVVRVPAERCNDISAIREFADSHHGEARLVHGERTDGAEIWLFGHGSSGNSDCTRVEPLVAEKPLVVDKCSAAGPACMRASPVTDCLSRTTEIILRMSCMQVQIGDHARWASSIAPILGTSRGLTRFADLALICLTRVPKMIQTTTIDDFPSGKPPVLAKSFDVICFPSAPLPDVIIRWLPCLKCFESFICSVRNQSASFQAAMTLSRIVCPNSRFALPAMHGTLGLSRLGSLPRQPAQPSRQAGRDTQALWTRDQQAPRPAVHEPLSMSDHPHP